VLIVVIVLKGFDQVLVQRSDIPDVIILIEVVAFLALLACGFM
jgi:hypothetical protein